MIPMIRRAWQQIDEAPGGGGALGWLVSFVREDPEQWVPGDAEARGHRLLAIIYGGIPENVVQLGDEITPLVPEDVVRVHRELLGFFTQLVTAPVLAEIRVPTDDLKESIVRLSPPSAESLIAAKGPRAAPAIFAVSRGGPRRTLLFQAVKRLVLASDQLMACPRCRRPFLALRKKKFCSATCLQAHHDEIKVNKRKAQRRGSR
jgi:hypothetical protein